MKHKNFAGHIKLSRPLNLKEAKILLDCIDNPALIEEEHPDGRLPWIPTETLDAIVYDGNDTSYNYADWLEWVLSLLQTCNITANGEIIIKIHDQFGWHENRLVIKNNELTIDPPRNTNPLTYKRLALLVLEKL
jgi:hypothetical protein